MRKKIAVATASLAVLGASLTGVAFAAGSSAAATHHHWACTTVQVSLKGSGKSFFPLRVCGTPSGMVRTDGGKARWACTVVKGRPGKSAARMNCAGFVAG